MKSTLQSARSFRFLALSCLVLLGLHVRSHALNFPDTVWIPVIYYDYHALSFDGNDDFLGSCLQCTEDGGIDTGMVGTKLDLEHKPDYKKNDCCNEHINEWYRPSDADGYDTEADFYYDSLAFRWKWTHMQPYKGRTGEFVSQDFDSTYPYTTVVIYDSLPFIHLGKNDESKKGLYNFSRVKDTLSDEPFFPIDNRGFGNEPYPGIFNSRGESLPDSLDHNYGFTTELHVYFEYRPGLTFNFYGDDDVWVFVEDSLVLDIGGIHAPKGDSISMDDLADRMNFEEGEKYRFSFFHAERQPIGSNVAITTNIFREIQQLQISTSSSVLKAGEEVELEARLRDEQGEVIPPDDSLYDYVEWEIAGGRQEGDRITSDSSGRTLTVTGTKAHRYLQVRATWTDPEDSTKTRSALAPVAVTPADPYRITLERDSLITKDGNEWEPDDLERDTITAADSQVVLFAFIRDRYNNIIEEGDSGNVNSINNPQGTDNADWQQEPASNSEFMTVFPADSITKRWVGIVKRNPFSGDSAVSSIIVSQDTLIPDTARVTLAYVSMGPQIETVEYKSPLEAGQNARDTMRIEFKEPVQWPYSGKKNELENNLDKIFTVYDKDLVDTTSALFSECNAKIEEVGETSREIVIMFDHNCARTNLMLGEDSLQLKVFKNPLTDTAGVGVKDTTRTYIKTIPSWKVVPATSPASPENPGYTNEFVYNPDELTPLPGTPVKEQQKGEAILTANEGIHTIIQSTAKIFRGEVIIYDAVGNVLAKKLPLYHNTDASKRGKYVFGWDGRNQNGRLVASGAYLAVITVETVDETSSQKNIKIAIQH